MMPATQPVLTIGIPAYNEGRFLRATLESIQAQTFSDFVVHICDDCSTDNTVDIANEFAARDARFRVWTSDRKLTFVENWGRSLEMCRSEYFAWIGAHDILDPGYFHEVIDRFSSDPSIVLVYPKSISIDVEGKKGVPMDSDITTSDRSIASILKIAFNLAYCTAIHGVFRTSVLKSLPLRRIIGFDYVILFLTSIYGKIAATEQVRFYRRVVRQESAEEAVDRWRRSGMFEKTEFDPFVELISLCVLEFYRRYQHSIVKRLITGQKLLRIFAHKHNVSRLEILRCVIANRN